MFVWYVDERASLSKKKLVHYFNEYYDGLMRVDEPMKSATDYIRTKTVSQFEESDDGYIGAMNVFDNFFTKEVIQLNIQVTEQFCLTSKKHVIRCDISPQEMDHEVWSLFKMVTFIKDCE
jgi:hypothetical protein